VQIKEHTPQSTAELSDAVLANMTLSGDQRAFEGLVQRYDFEDGDVLGETLIRRFRN